MDDSQVGSASARGVERELDHLVAGLLQVEAEDDLPLNGSGGGATWRGIRKAYAVGVLVGPHQDHRRLTTGEDGESDGAHQEPGEPAQTTGAQYEQICVLRGFQQGRDGRSRDRVGLDPQAGVASGEVCPRLVEKTPCPGALLIAGQGRHAEAEGRCAGGKLPLPGVHQTEGQVAEQSLAGSPVGGCQALRCAVESGGDSAGHGDLLQGMPRVSVSLGRDSRGQGSRPACRRSRACHRSAPPSPHGRTAFTRCSCLPLTPWPPEPNGLGSRTAPITAMRVSCRSRRAVRGPMAPSTAPDGPPGVAHRWRRSS